MKNCFIGFIMTLIIGDKVRLSVSVTSRRINYIRIFVFYPGAEGFGILLRKTRIS